MWFDEAVFYQIYPLGFCGAERENDFGETRHRFQAIEAEIPKLLELGVTAVLFNPLFESERHGYDTVDFFRADRRLGTNGELAHMVDALHAAGIRVVFDGVFNHVGRGFPPFREVLEKREGTDYRFWFNVDFHGNSRYNDGLSYADWEGHPELVKLRLENADLQNYLMDAVRFWIREFHIDGLRLDVSYLLPPWFMELLRRTVNAEKEDFFLMGEVIHLNNFAQNLCPSRLDSITNYEGYRSLVSAFNSRNLFEIEYSLSRLFGNFPWALLRGKNLFSFVDNHDVERAATALKEGRNLFGLYSVLFTMPGIPCIYYGSEYAAKGDKSEGDYRLRPAACEIDRSRSDLFSHLARLARLRAASPALAYGTYTKVTLRNTDFSFLREGGGERLLVAVNIAETDCVLHAGDGEGEDVFTGERTLLSEVHLPPFSSKIFRKI